MRTLAVTLVTTAVGVSLAATLPARAEFPQVKINHVDTTEAPKIRVWATLLRPGLKPPGEKDVIGATVFRKPQGTSAVELFGFQDGEIVWPKGLSEEDIKKKVEPEMAYAAELDKGASIVVIAPGFQDPEYRNGTLGERSRAGTGLFFKKLGKANKMNLIWYSDYILSYVYTEGRTNELSKLDAELANCAKWERDQLKNFGKSAEELAAESGEEPGKDAPAGPKKGEAKCGLTAEYATFPDMLKGSKAPYDGFWPNVFGLQQKICMQPEQARKSTGFTREGETQKLGMTAIDAGLQMLVKDGDPSMPRILIITGDGRDGYIKAPEDCKTRYQADCADKEEIKALKGAAQKTALKACVDASLQADINVEQSSFAKKLPTWLAVAKGAGIRIYTVSHPTALKYQRERLDVLAWRTGGTARSADDPNDVIDRYDDLMGELNNQVVFTFTDEEAVPGTTPSYIVELRTKGAKFTSEPYVAPEVAPKVEVSFFKSIKKLGESKLGKVGFMAALAGVGLIVLLLFVKIGKKIFGKGKDAVGKAGKAAAGKGKDAKDKAKLIEKAKKAKEAQKKAMEKAKKKAGG